MKKKKKLYIAGKGVKKAELKRAALKKYNYTVLFVETLDDADLALVMSDEAQELDNVNTLNVPYKMINVNADMYEEVEKLEITQELDKNCELSEEKEEELELGL